MKLNARLQTAQNAVTQIPIVLIHGLFGSLDNLGTLARGLAPHYHTVQLDLRNHGLSPRDISMRYACQAQDILDTLDACDVSRAVLVGHSMGGKVAMALSARARKRIAGLVMLDIAPVDYQVRRHDDIFAALHAVNAAGVTTRHEALNILNARIKEPAVSHFLLKSFVGGAWRFNVPVLEQEYDRIVGWETIPAWPHPVLFISGSASPYIQPHYQTEIERQFPKALMETVVNAGHWVHAEQPAIVQQYVEHYLLSHIVKNG